jgi:hypothetical protein
MIKKYKKPKKKTVIGLLVYKNFKVSFIFFFCSEIRYYRICSILGSAERSQNCL